MGKTLVLDAIKFTQKRKSLMEQRLIHNIVELQNELKLANKKLLVAIEGLKVIKDSTDNYHVASKTLEEIKSM